MKAVWAVFLLVLAAKADEPDHTRGLLYRLDAETREVRLHPDQAWGRTKQVQREAGDAADRLDAEGLHREAWSLRRQASALANAAQRDQWQDTRAQAINLQSMLRQIDEALPPHDIAH
jgi:hypothetical protein